MKRIEVDELKEHLSRYLREVERGWEVEITDRERPIARIVPVRRDGPSLVLIAPTRPFSEVRIRRHPPARWGVGSIRLRLEERQQR